MPTYEYACRQCGNHLDVVQKFTDDPLTTCPSCSGSLRKVFGNIGISFKGSGFYKNDSRSSDNGGKADGDKSDKSDKSDKGDKKADPAAKSESSAKAGEKTSSGSDGSTTTKSNGPKADAPRAAS